jgi:hypothetical protein
MPIQIPFQIVSEACEKTESSVILIGGQALGALGYQRATMDIDFMVTEEDYKKIKPSICDSGYQEVVRTHTAAKLRAARTKLMDIDFLFVDQNTFHRVQKESKMEYYQDSKLLVPKAEHLIALKLHAIQQQPELRELKDLNDIVELIRANQVDVRSDSFRTLCLKFGTLALYEKICQHVRPHG